LFQNTSIILLPFRSSSSIIHFPSSDVFDSHEALPPLFSLIHTSYAITDSSLFNLRTSPRWLSQLIGARLRKKLIHPWDYVPTLPREEFKLGLNFYTLITMRHHTRASLHLVAIVAETIISTTTLLKDNHDSFIILATQRSTWSQEIWLLVQASLCKVHLWMRFIRANHFSINHRRHPVKHSKLFFPSPPSGAWNLPLYTQGQMSCSWGLLFLETSH